jgi:hypothetical protein
MSQWFTCEDSELNPGSDGKDLWRRFPERVIAFQMLSFFGKRSFVCASVSAGF